MPRFTVSASDGCTDSIGTGLNLCARCVRTGGPCWSRRPTFVRWYYKLLQVPRRNFACSVTVDHEVEFVRNIPDFSPYDS